jgi:amino-acid N-acetyltransferase
MSMPTRHGVRITDIAAMECSKEAAGELRLDIEAAFSQGLPNTPMAHSAIRIISGNFVTARPIGIVNGVDFGLTGVTRKVAAKPFIKFWKQAVWCCLARWVSPYR